MTFSRPRTDHLAGSVPSRLDHTCGNTRVEQARIPRSCSLPSSLRQTRQPSLSANLSLLSFWDSKQKIVLDDVLNDALENILKDVQKDVLETSAFSSLGDRYLGYSSLIPKNLSLRLKIRIVFIPTHIILFGI